MIHAMLSKWKSGDALIQRGRVSGRRPFFLGVGLSANAASIPFLNQWKALVPRNGCDRKRIALPRLRNFLSIQCNHLHLGSRSIFRTAQSDAMFPCFLNSPRALFFKFNEPGKSCVWAVFDRVAICFQSLLANRTRLFVEYVGEDRSRPR